MNMNGMNFESKRQELAGRLVEREVRYCVSSLVSTLSALAQNCDSRVLRDECLDWEEDILPLLEWVDYEEALRQYVMDDADLDDMENMVEECGYWDGLVDASGYTTYLSEFTPTPEKEEADEFSEWLDAEQGRESNFREAVADFLIENGNAVAILPDLMRVRRRPAVRVVDVDPRRRVVFTATRTAISKTPAIVACRAALASAVPAQRSASPPCSGPSARWWA